MWQHRRLCYVRVFTLLAVVLVTSGVDAASGKGSFQKCLACHKDLQGAMMLKDTHAPFKKMQCGSCHDPHTSNYKFLVKKEIGALCKDCHAKKAVVYKVTHLPVEKGDCTKCHHPHASNNRNLLVAKDQDICFSCHSPEQIFLGGKKHAPAKQGQCLTCHDPHGSDNGSLLRKSKKKVCMTCHSLKGKRSQEAHQSYPVSGTNCVSCHNPHGSKKNNLIKKNQHKPFKDDNCMRCHRSPSSDNPLAMNRKGALVCLQCHEEVNKDFSKINTHIQNGIFCVNCHNPHASDQSGLKKGVLTKTCFVCHQDTQWRVNDKKSKYIHPEVAKGDCNVCHNPHGSNFRLFFLSDEFAVCTTCHKRHAKFSHPVGTDAVDPRSKRDITCITCHDLMGSQYEFALRFDRKKELCIQCHASY